MQCIGPEATVERVVVGLALEGVIARVAKEVVFPPAAPQQVVVLTSTMEGRLTPGLIVWRLFCLHGGLRLGRAR